jgi:CRISPR-associated protein Cas1
MIDRSLPTVANTNGSSVPSDVPAVPAAELPDVPDLLPVRMLNEFTYCPRLAYLEWVQGEWADNRETADGTFVHRNVDQPTRQAPPVPDHDPADEQQTDEKPIHARSLTLAAEGEGLIAKLDVLESDGTAVTPVDYKRGNVPKIPEGAYEPERVQLCAQGLILRENGYHCTEGVIYYVASRRRVTIPFDDALIARTRELAAQFRSTAAAGKLPSPLIDSPKCPRCSLVGICLPDETNLLRDEPALPVTTRTQRRETSPGLRRLLPARHDALPLYVQKQGVFVGKSADRITLSYKGEQLDSARLIDVSQLCLFGNITVSAPALRELAAKAIPICHYSYGGWFHSLTTGFTHKNVELRIAQSAIAADPARALAISRRFISGKIRNCRTMLRRHLDNNKSPVLAQLDEYRQLAESADSAARLLGLEGMAAKNYFAGFFSLLPPEFQGDIDGRNRRPPRDPVNAVLSFVYALLVKELTVVLQAVGVDPMLGFFHRPRYGRPSLALDLAEEFRPLIGDSVLLTVFNNQEVQRGSFLERAGAVALTQSGRAAVIAAFERRLQTEIKHPLFGYRVSYRRILEVQARLLARTVTGELAEYPNFCTR